MYAKSHHEKTKVIKKLIKSKTNQKLEIYDLKNLENDMQHYISKTK